MRAIIAAIALVLAIGAVMPTEADARAPRKVEKWGCTFKFGGWDVNSMALPPIWFGYGLVRHCDKTRKYVVTEEVYKAIPGAPDRLFRQNKYVWWLGHDYSPLGVGGNQCTPEGHRLRYPVYYQMTVKRKGRPGIVRVASANRANPCPAGTWPTPGLGPGPPRGADLTYVGHAAGSLDEPHGHAQRGTAPRRTPADSTGRP